MAELHVTHGMKFPKEIKERTYELINLEFKNKQKLFPVICSKGYIKTSQYLIEITERKSLIDIHYNNDEAFHASCKNNRLEVAKWLVEYCDNINSPINLSDSEEETMYTICVNGYIDMVKWLINLREQRGVYLDFQILNKKGFIKKMQFNGYPELARYIRNIMNYQIDESNF